MKPTMSQRAFARHIGVNHSAVRKAIASGRLAASIVQVAGVAQIVDLEIAVAEWNAGRRPRADDSTGKGGESNYHRARARREEALAGLAELELQDRQGKFVEVEEAQRQYVDEVTIVKTRLLGIPTRVKQRMPHICVDDIRQIDELVREALEELSDELATRHAKQAETAKPTHKENNP